MAAQHTVNMLVRVRISLPTPKRKEMKMDTYRIQAAIDDLRCAAEILKQSSSNSYQWERAKDFERTADIAEKDLQKLIKLLRPQ